MHSSERTPNQCRDLNQNDLDLAVLTGDAKKLVGAMVMASDAMIGLGGQGSVRDLEVRLLFLTSCALKWVTTQYIAVQTWSFLLSLTCM